MAFVRIFSGGKLLQQLELTKGPATIGRAPDNDIVLMGRGVSKHHAVIEKRADTYVIRDLGSANGMFFRNERFTEHTLRYWDEVQIFGHVLKFMASSRLKGEEAGTDAQAREQATNEHTMAVDMTRLGDLAQLRKQTKIPALVLGGAPMTDRLALSKVNFRIGKGGNCDVRLSGWLAPKIAAHIQRRSDGFYLVPGLRGRVSVNGQRLRKQVQLSDGDAIDVRNLQLTFYNRPPDQY